jgi:hypothetical protein
MIGASCHRPKPRYCEQTVVPLNLSFALLLDLKNPDEAIKDSVKSVSKDGK